MRRMIRECYAGRIIADYSAGITTNRDMAAKCLTSAMSMIRSLEQP